MSFWSGEKLRRHAAQIISPFDPADPKVEDHFDCNAFILRMGNEYFSTSDEIPTVFHHSKVTELKWGEAFVIHPGQFAYLLTQECVKIPHDAMAFISMRTEIKFSGLINVSGFHVNPGYEGKLIYAVFNAGPSPVSLRQGEPAFKIWFCDLEQRSSKTEAPGSGIEHIESAITRGMNQRVVSLHSLARRLDSVQTQMRVQWGIFAAMSAVALVLLGVVLTDYLEAKRAGPRITPAALTKYQPGRPRIEGL